VNAVLWDLDDTLLDTLPARMASLKHAYEATVGGWVDPIELWRSHRGGTLEALGQRLLGDDYRRFTVAYRDHYYARAGRGPAFAGVRTALEACREADLPMAVVTSKISWGATEELEKAGLLQYFGAVVGFDDTEKHKPDPEPVYAAMARLLVDDPGVVAFIGDSPADIFAARNSGALSIAATWGTLDRDLLLDAHPDVVADSPSEAVAAVASRMQAVRP
jgi:pyrophosphatase PpaX